MRVFMKGDILKEAIDDYIELAMCYDEVSIAEFSYHMIQLATEIIMECAPDEKVGIRRVREATTFGINRFIDNMAKKDAQQRYNNAHSKSNQQIKSKLGRKGRRDGVSS